MKQVKLSQAELEKIIQKTQANLKSLEIEEGEDDDADDDEENGDNEEDEVTQVKEEMATNGERDIEKLYSMDTYDDDSDDNTAGGIEGLMAFPDPESDPYFSKLAKDDEDSDDEDFVIRKDDNLVLVGHVEGNAAILEVYGNSDLTLALQFFFYNKNFFYSAQCRAEFILRAS